MKNVRLGLFGIGLDAYWPQFPGLKPRLEGYVARVEKLARPAWRWSTSAWSTPRRRRLRRRPRFRRQDVDLIFLHVTTYALSSTVLPVVLRAKVPVIVLNLAARAGHRLRRLQRPRGPHAG
jgi:L-arabinose isomerase